MAFRLANAAAVALLASAAILTPVTAESICTLSDSEICAVDSLTPSDDDGSVLIYPGGNTRCDFDDYTDSATTFSTNSTYFFQVFPNTKADKSKLMIFFQGGGACADEDTCAFGLQCSLGASATFTTAATSSSAGVLDRSLEDNMFKDWNIVFIPYCTDSYVGVVPKEHPAAELLVYYGACTNDFGLFEDIVAACEAGTATTIEMIEALLQAQPEGNWLFVDSKGDKTQRYFYALVSEGILGYPFSDLISEEYFFANMSAILDAYQTASSRITTFYVEGTKHVFLADSNFTSYESDEGLLLGDVINAWLVSNSSLNTDTTPEPTPSLTTATSGATTTKTPSTTTATPGSSSATASPATSTSSPSTTSTPSITSSASSPSASVITSTPTTTAPLAC
ncbi:hypothetical protein PF001_g15161 [Phytophthora fragariae]|uniref:Uncharacterized protein n=1 Tax=Phytophthora fragariae TaxID=53985 RepID=A0A6A4D4S0_9STRA|nr:hypothetical protein PF001_g15161 [Phytophthora fragariae]